MDPSQSGGPNPLIRGLPNIESINNSADFVDMEQIAATQPNPEHAPEMSENPLDEFKKQGLIFDPNTGMFREAGKEPEAPREPTLRDTLRSHWNMLPYYAERAPGVISNFFTSLAPCARDQAEPPPVNPDAPPPKQFNPATGEFE